MKASNLLRPGRFFNAERLRVELANAISHFETAMARGADSTAEADTLRACLDDVRTKLDAIVPSTSPVGGIRVVSVDAGAATASIAVGATLQLAPVISPSDATVKKVTYSTSNAARATVSATGLVTGVAAGAAATITVTTADGAKTDTVAVTVTA